MTTRPDRAGAAPARSRLRAVALPTEHGGWGLTAEPVVLGLLLAPSGPGALLGAAAALTFLVRTPLKLALVDRRRHRRLDRTRVAERVAAVELLLLVVLVVGIAGTASGRWWVPIALAAPVAAVQLWFDVRSRSRRLLAELAGAVAICSVAAAIVVADGGRSELAAAAWLVLAARATASVPFVHGRVAELHARAAPRWATIGGHLVALALLGAAVAVDRLLLPGAAAVAAVVVWQVVSGRRPAPRAVVLGTQQAVLGLVVVLVSWLGTRR